MTLQLIATNQLARCAAVLTMVVLALCQLDASSASAGVVYSFGWNSNGQTGLGVTDDFTLIATPIDTTNLAGKTITQVASNLVLADDGTVFSFGSNYNGQTGLGLDDGATLIATPIDTTNLAGKKITQVAHAYQSLLLADDGTVFSFGPNSHGRTGLGVDDGNTLVATAIDTTNLGGKTIIQVATAPYHSLLLADDGTVFSFGTNQDGLTGMGTTFEDTLIATPIDTTNLADKKITQVAAGEWHSLLLADDGDVFVFGSNARGQAGLGMSLGSLIATPIDTTNLSGKTITQLAAGRFHSLLLADDGTVFSFGWNDLGQTGLGTDLDSTLIATPIDTSLLGEKTISAICAGDRLSLLLADDGTVFSFGHDNGRAGLGTTSLYTPVATPIDTTNLADMRVVGISTSGDHSLLLAVPVPEPSSITLLLGFAPLGILAYARRMRRGRR